MLLKLNSALKRSPPMVGILFPWKVAIVSRATEEYRNVDSVPLTYIIVRYFFKGMHECLLCYHMMRLELTVWICTVQIPFDLF